MTDLGPLTLRNALAVDTASVPSPASVQLLVLGPLTVRVAAGETRPRASRQRRLLSVLAVNARGQRSISVDEMIYGLYGADASERSRHSLATELWRARQSVGARAIVTDADGYRLDLEHCDVDALQFEANLAAARAALRNCEYDRAEEGLAAALALWRGDPLPDLVGTTTGRAAVGRLVELYAGGRVDHAEALAAVGRRHEAVALLENVTAAEPTREHAWALLVETAAAMGNLRIARTALDTARRTLAGYGVELGDELDAARRHIDAAARPEQTLRVADPRMSAAPIGPSGPPASADPPEPSTDAAGAVGPGPTLVGRVAEAAALDACVQKAFRHERLQLAFVCGEAGIGKTALAEHVLDRLTSASSTRSVVRMYCDWRADLPYGPIVAALRAIGARPDAALAPLMSDQPGTSGEAPGAAPSHGELMTLHAAIAEAFEAHARSDGGLVLFVEDAHWAPPATLDALRGLVARRAQVPLAVVLTVRDPAGATPGTDATVTDLRRRADSVIALRGLDVASSADLLGSDGDITEADRLHRVTGGNPLYLRHLRGVAGDQENLRVPSLDDAVDDHLDAVSAPTAHVLALAAVIGTQVDARLLAAAAARAAEPVTPMTVLEAVEEATAAGLLRRRADSDTLSWMHEVVCSRLYATLPVATRAALHLAVAVASEHLVGGAPVPVDLIAHHYLAGWPLSPTATVVSRLASAGDHAAAQLDFTGAARYYHRASDLLGIDPAYAEPELRADLLEAEGHALIAAAGLHDTARAEVDLDRARLLFTTLARSVDPGHATRRLRAYLGVARAHGSHRIDEPLLDDIAAAVDAAIDDATDREPDHVTAIGEGLAQLRPYRPGQTGTLLERAVRADPTSSGRLRADAWAQQSVTERLATARLLVRDDSADPVAAWIRLWVSEVAAGRRALDDPPPGRPGSGDGDERSWWEIRAWEATAAIAGGRWARAERLLTEASTQVRDGRTAAEIATRAAAVSGQRIRLMLLRSPTGTISGVEVPAGTWVTSHPVISQPVIQSWAAYMAAVTGHIELASPACDQLIEQYHDGTINDADLLPWACGTATVALAARHRCAAELVSEVLRPHSGHFAIHTFTALWGSIDHYLGRLALLLGDPQEATDRLDAAVVQYRHAGARPYQARALHDLAVAGWRRGGPARTNADVLRHEASALLRELDPDAQPPCPWPPQEYESPPERPAAFEAATS